MPTHAIPNRGVPDSMGYIFFLVRRLLRAGCPRRSADTRPSLRRLPLHRRHVQERNQSEHRRQTDRGSPEYGLRSSSTSTSPRCGPRSCLLLALMQTPHRFRSKRQRWTYSVLAIETHDSAQYPSMDGQPQRSKKPQQVRGLNQNRNHAMKDTQEHARSLQVWVACHREP